MKVRVLYFAEASRILQKSEEEMEITEKTVSGLLKMLGSLHPEIRSVLNNSMVAVNLQYRDKNYFLKDGDTVAIIPPVDGG